MKRNYTRLGYKEFGKALLKTGDLDPVYIMLIEAQLPRATLLRFCLAYWCFYHVGVAAYIAEKPAFFWHRMREAHDKKFPRGSERRHFRGGISANTIAHLRAQKTSPEKIAEAMMRGTTFKEVSASVKQWPNFGPWIAFKIADMKDRVLGEPVDFSDCALDIYRDPVKGAALIAHGDVNRQVDIEKVVARLVKEFSSFKAPPLFDRPVNVQEVETIMCKYKSHYNGHYPVGNDTAEVENALAAPDWGKLAARLRKHVRERIDQKEFQL